MIYESDLAQMPIIFSANYTCTATEQLTPYIKYANFDFPTNLPYKPLLIGEYSFNQNFEPAYPMVIPGAATDILAFGEVVCFADQSNVHITMLVPNAQPTIYCRVIGFPNPLYQGETPIVNIRQDWRFDTDFKYPQIYSADSTTDLSTTVYHGLGYTPIVMAWCVGNGENGIPNDAIIYTPGVFHNINDLSAKLDVQDDLYKSCIYYVIKGGQ